MYTVRAIKTNGKHDENQLLTFKLYHEFRHAFSDILNEYSDLNHQLADMGYKHDTSAIQTIIYGSEDENGYGDDFEFRYPDGVVITLGESIIADDSLNNNTNERRN